MTLVVLTGSCTAGETSDTSTIATSTPTTKTTITTTTTTQATSTTAPACPPLPVYPVEASSVSTITVDMTGDGTDDTLSTYLVEGLEWRVRLDVSSGTGSEVTLEDSDPLVMVQPVAVADVDIDGTAELFVAVDAGAYTANVGMFTFSDCELIRVTASGVPLLLPVGASVLNLAGFRCIEGGIEAIVAASDDGEQFQGEAVAYRLEGSEAVEVSRRPVEGTLEEIGPLTAAGC